MQLQWYATPGGNFGDDLNLLLWPRLFPDLHRQRHGALFYGIGTILGGRHDRTSIKVVLGSGRGDAQRPAPDANWDFRWVRGPHTARVFGLPPERGLGDSAWLWDGLQPADGRGADIGLLPHHATWDSFDWRDVAARAGLRAINPKQSPQAIVAELQGCRRLLTESLHGAVFADAMGIAWAPAVLSYRFNAFKWRDWLATVGRPFEPLVLDRPLVQRLSLGKSVGNRLARWTDWRGDMRCNALRPLTPARPADVQAVARALGRFSVSPQAFACSEGGRVQARRERMRAECARFARDYGLRFTS